MTRLMVMTFWGSERFREGHADDHSAHKPHESPWSMTVPLIVLAAALLFVRLKVVGNVDYFPGDGRRIMWCWDPKTIPAIARLATSFALCQRWFCSVPGETWPNRQFAHAATSAGTVDIVTALYRDRTIFELLDDNGCDWRIYYDGPAKARVVSRLLDVLEQRGYFFLGHSETLNMLERVRSVGPTIYQLRNPGTAAL